MGGHSLTLAPSHPCHRRTLPILISRLPLILDCPSQLLHLTPRVRGTKGRWRLCTKRGRIRLLLLPLQLCRGGEKTAILKGFSFLPVNLTHAIVQSAPK